MDFSTWFSNNQFFSGGLVLMIFGAAMMWLKGIPKQIYNLIERFFILKIEILDEDEAYQWMQLWLSERLHKTLSISVITKRNKPLDEEIPLDMEQNKPRIYFVPAVGTYFFWYKKRFVTLNRDRKDNTTSNSLLQSVSDGKSSLRTMESFTIRVFSRNKDLARQIMEECREKACPADGKIDIRVATYSYWSLSCRINARPINSVILDGNQANDLLSDVKQFLNNQEWYQKVGVPWRRGYLLKGKPGSGKSSIIKAIAGELNMNIYVLMLSDPEMTDNRINDLLVKVGDRSILLLEDIDCAFTQRIRSNGREGGITFSGLLNAIDGVASSEGRIFFMTTNHEERLDPALIRPGRADVHMYFDNATQDQASRLFERFFPTYTRLSIDFGKMISERQYSMATLQHYLMLHRGDPMQAIRNIDLISELQLKS